MLACMSYTGAVEVGGPADVQDAGDLQITKVAVGGMTNNAYLLKCTLTGEQVLIDAANDADALPVTVDVRVQTGARVRVGSCELEVIGLVGHTPGSIALAYDDPDGIVHLFTGDSLFPGGVGNTFGDADAFVKLIDDVESKLFDRFPDDSHVYPGHGNDTVLGIERPHLAEWRERGW